MSIKDLIGYIKIYRKYIGRRLYIVFALTIAAALTEGFGITLLLPLLRTADKGGSAEDTSRAEQLLNDLLAWMGIDDSMAWILVFIGVVFVLKGLLKFAESAYRGILQAKLLKDLKTRLYDLYSHIDYRYYLEKNTGHFINVINQQVNQFFLSFENFMGFIIQSVMTLSYFAIAFALTWRFALMALGVGIVVMVLFRILNRYVRGFSRRVSSEESVLNSLLVQGLQALKYVISTGKTPTMRREVRQSIERLMHDMKWQRIARAFTTALKEPVTILFIVGIIAIQVRVMNQPLAPIFVAIILFNRGMQAMMSIQANLQTTMERIGAVEMVDREFETILQRQETSGSEKAGPLSRSIEYRDVSFSYDETEEPVLKEITLEISARSTVAFVGESGAGKSTLVDTLTLLLKPQDGHLLIDGRDSRELDVHAWRSQIGYVSQETVVFDDTIANNISLWEGDPANDPELMDRIEEAARKAYAHGFIKDLPQGYDTSVGDRGVRLSGGQRQRLFIARELFKNPNLLILDEATSALDTESERYIQQSIDALRGEMTVVIIAHRLSTIKNVDEVFVLDEGRLIEKGTYEGLTTQEKSRFREMVEMQSL